MIENGKRNIIEQQSPQDANLDVPHASTLKPEPQRQGLLSKLFGFHNTEHDTHNTQPDIHLMPSEETVDTYPSVGSEDATDKVNIPPISENLDNNNNPETSQENIEMDLERNHPVPLARRTFTEITTTSPNPDEYRELLGRRTNRRNVLKGIAGIGIGAIATKAEGLVAMAQVPTSQESLSEDSQSEKDQHTEVLSQSNENTQEIDSTTSAKDSVQSNEIQPVEQSISVEKREYDRPFENNVGWAYQAVDKVNREQIFSDMRDMKSRGCNSVYVGHPNPGDSLFYGKTEPGLDFSMYHSIMTKEPTTLDPAQRVLERVTDVLDAAKECEFQVVLPVGYKISMGPQWSDENGQELRKAKNGKNLETWGTERTASPYSEKYWQDIERYYRWLNENVISKYDNIKTINIADEPMGGDFSSHAMGEFRRRYGVDYDSATDEQKGEFQLGVIPDYAIKSANLWKKINPDLLTTMTFHIQRESPFSFDVERIFREAPDTFVFSADTHLYDAPPEYSMTKEGIRGLYGMARMLGLFSKTYNRGLMLWQGANAWSFDKDGKAPELGLNSAQDSANLNLHIVHDVVKAAGGKIDMIFGWGHPNVQPVDQILEGVSSQSMYEFVTNKLSQVRDSLSEVSDSIPSEVITIPRSEINRFAGKSLDGSNDPGKNHILETGSFFNLSDIDFENRDLAVILEGSNDVAAEYARQHGSKVDSEGTKDELPFLEKLAGLPGDVRKLESGDIWYGQPPGYLIDAVKDLKQKYEQKGVDWTVQFGYFKGCMYFKGPDNNYWPYMVFERGVFHPVAGRFELSLTYRDMANEKVELGENNRIFAEFPEDAKKRLKTTPITGDAHSQAPSFEKFRKYMTVNEDNKDPDMTGQFANIALDKQGTPLLREGVENEKFKYTYYDGGTGHNIPKVIKDEITRRFGENEKQWWPELGRPTSNAYWVESDIDGKMQWVLTQTFERGMLTYHPDYDGKEEPQWVTQGALTGNHFMKLFNNGEDTAYKDSYLHMFD